MDRTSFRRLRRQPGYPLFYATATITRFADDMFSVGTVLLVLERTGSAPLAGGVVAAVTLPSLLTGPLLGAWLDRAKSRRRVMMLDQALAASTIVALVLLAGNAPNWTLPIVALGAGITWPLSFGGFTSLIPTIVPEDLLAPANAFEATSFNLAIICGPALAGTISAIAGPATSLLVEAALTAGVIALIVRIPSLDAPTGQPSAGPCERSPARACATSCACRRCARPPRPGPISLGGAGPAHRRLSLLRRRRSGRGPQRGGIPVGGVRAGSTIGAITMVRLQTRWRADAIVIGGIAGLGALMLTWPLASALPVALVLIMLAGMADGPGLRPRSRSGSAGHLVTFTGRCSRRRPA